MQLWRNLPFRGKALLAFATVFLCTLALGVFGLSQTAAVNAEAVDISGNWLPSTQRLGRLATSLENVRIWQFRIVVAALKGEPERLAKGLEGFRSAVAATEKAYADYQPLIAAGTRDEELMRQFAAAWAKFQTSSAAVVAKAVAGDAGMLALFRGEDLANISAAIDASLADVDYNAEEGRKAAVVATAVYENGRILTIFAIVFCALVCAGAGGALIASTARPLREAAASLERLASGDLDVTVSHADRRDEIGALARALDIFKGKTVEARQVAAAQAAEQKAKEQRVLRLEQLVTAFEGVVGRLTGQLAAGSTELEATAQAMSSAADQANG